MKKTCLKPPTGSYVSSTGLFIDDLPIIYIYIYLVGGYQYILFPIFHGELQVSPWVQFRNSDLNELATHLKRVRMKFLAPGSGDQQQPRQ